MSEYEEYVCRHYPDSFGEKFIPRFGEPIVRCRDCYFADEIEGGYWCDRFGNGKEHTTPNGFCAWGERRDA